MRTKLLASLTFVIVAVMFTAILILPTTFKSQAQGGVTGFQNVRVSNFYRAQPRNAITVTQDLVINPTGTFQRLTSAGAVSTSGGTIIVEPTGTLLILVNVGSNTITITETGTLKSAGNIALGALDSATLLSDGVSWYQIAASNN